MPDARVPVTKSRLSIGVPSIGLYAGLLSPAFKRDLLNGPRRLPVIGGCAEQLLIPIRACIA